MHHQLASCTIFNMQAAKLEQANAELSNRAVCLKEDKERLLRMVSRLELERHDQQTLQDENGSQQSRNSSGRNRCDVSADARGQGKAGAEPQIHRESKGGMYVGALTDLIELNYDTSLHSK